MFRVLCGFSAPQQLICTRNLSLRSKEYIRRQANDPFVKMARREGWRSRAAIKLIQLDEKLRILKPGGRVVDLGGAPGGWAQVAVKALRKGGAKANAVVCVDLLAMEPLKGVEVCTVTSPPLSLFSFEVLLSRSSSFTLF